MSDSQTTIDRLRKIRLCIITAKEEELLRIKREFSQGIQWERKRLCPSQHRQDIFIGRFTLKDDKTEDFYITSCSSQSIQTFAIEATHLFTILKPKWALHAGVCAARKDEKMVVIAERASNYDETLPSAHDTERAPVQPVIPRPIRGLKEWVTSHSQGRWLYGAFTTGSAVRMDAQEIIEKMREFDVDTCALDMEASAFLHVCQYLKIKSLGVFKGVSDYGDARKFVDNEVRYKAALEDTARAVEEWATHYFSELIGT